MMRACKPRQVDRTFLVDTTIVSKFCSEHGRPLGRETRKDIYLGADKLFIIQAGRIERHI